MILFVTEKPDVGRELAAWLGRVNKLSPIKTDFGIKVGNNFVTWAFGHLLELAEPDHYFQDKGFQKGATGKFAWSDIPLPVLPNPFVLVPSAGKKQRLDEIIRLIGESEVVYNATDLDREGQLIFDEIITYMGKRPMVPIYRMTFASLNDVALSAAYASAMDNDQPRIRNAGLAAKTRREADWLVGMNATRALTLTEEGGVANLGRVLTPTMSIVVRRQKEIDAFVPESVYTPVIELPDGSVLTWSKRGDGKDIPGIKDGRIIDRALAESIIDNINNGLRGVITESKSTEQAEQPPLPFSLPSIQAELVKRHGLSVADITKACQSLYERKMQTYAGTDCRYLPESMHTEAINVLNGLSSQYRRLTHTANASLKGACWNDNIVGSDGGSAHHAIIPTGVVGRFDSEAEKLVFDAVSKRYIAQFHPDYKYLSISLVGEFGDDEFRASSRVMLSPGWRSVDEVSDDTLSTETVKDRIRERGLSR